MRAYQRLHTFDVGQPIKPWLAKIAYRLAQERWRTNMRQKTRERTAAQILKQNRDEREPADRLIAAEQSDALWQAVYALPMAERTAVVLYYREGLSVKDIAAVMGVAPGTVKTHLFRARSQIQANLRSKGFDEGDLP